MAVSLVGGHSPARQAHPVLLNSAVEPSGLCDFSKQQGSVFRMIEKGGPAVHPSQPLAAWGAWPPHGGSSGDVCDFVCQGGGRQIARDWVQYLH